MTQLTLLAIFAYYAKIGAALFPIPAGQKNPTGLVGSFAKDCSRDPDVWRKWAADNPGCNFGVVAGAGNMITVDIDVKAGREQAWEAYCELCKEWGIDPAKHMPHVESPSGGWHVYLSVPEGVDANRLRQPDAVKGVINIRAGNGYVVAAGSVVDGKHYTLLSDAAPYPAPEPLVKHCSRGSGNKSATVNPGTRDPADVTALVDFLREQNQFTAYEDWVGIGMALKLEYGDGGLEIWRRAHDDSVVEEVEAQKWDSFATEPAPGVQTLNTWIQRARKIGWHKNIRKTTSALFGDVAGIAAAAGAQLAGFPLLGATQVLVDISRPILDDLTNASDLPTQPFDPDYPRLPDTMAQHPLYEQMQQCIARIVAMGDNGPKGFRRALVEKPLAVLFLLNPNTYSGVIHKLEKHQVNVAESKIKRAVRNIEGRLERGTKDLDDYQRDPKSNDIQSNNPDNLNVFLGDVYVSVRWNAWLKRPEVKAGPGSEFYAEWPEWTVFDDNVAGRLIWRAEQTGTRFMAKTEWFWARMIALARMPANTHDPAKDRLDELQAKWDRVPRLISWLTTACGVPCDPYHQAVGKNIIGGLVRRIRKPGCKHDTCAVIIGPQGYKKSWLCKLISPEESWFTDSVSMGESAKELIGLLTGKAVVEFAEMSKRTKDVNEIKSMLTRVSDYGRVPYAKSPEERQRRCIFMATTNDDTPLIDDTGNRRFYPVRIDQIIDVDWLRDNINQLIGEAAHLEAAGHDFLVPDNVLAEATRHQEAARLESDMELQLAEWLAEPELMPLTYITPGELGELAEAAKWRDSNQRRNTAMKRIGFRYEQAYVGGRKTRIWVRGPKVQAKHIERVGARYEFSNATGRIRVKAIAPNTPRV
jgi:predicted P-loop ATPase